MSKFTSKSHSTDKSYQVFSQFSCKHEIDFYLKLVAVLKWYTNLVTDVNIWTISKKL